MKSLLHTAALCVDLLIAPASVLAAPGCRRQARSERRQDRRHLRCPQTPQPARACAWPDAPGLHRHRRHPAGTRAKGKVIADVVFTALMPSRTGRPFALNGGPGASSVYLNMGAIGPKVTFGSRVTARRRRPPCDNPGTWLDFTTWCSSIGRHRLQPRVGDDEAKKALYNPSARHRNTCHARSTTGCCMRPAHGVAQVPDWRAAAAIAARASPATCRPGWAWR